MACQLCHKQGRPTTTIVVCDANEGGTYRLIVCLSCKGDK